MSGDRLRSAEQPPLRSRALVDTSGRVTDGPVPGLVENSQHLLGEGWCTKLEAGVRGTIRGFIEALLEEELEAALGRARYERARTAPERPAAAAAGLCDEVPAAPSRPANGHRNGRRERQIIGTFGAATVTVPRARIETARPAAARPNG